MMKQILAARVYLHETNAKKHKFFLKPIAEERQGRQEKGYDVFFPTNRCYRTKRNIKGVIYCSHPLN